MPPRGLRRRRSRKLKVWPARALMSAAFMFIFICPQAMAQTPSSSPSASCEAFPPAPQPSSSPSPAPSEEATPCIALIQHDVEQSRAEMLIAAALVTFLVAAILGLKLWGK